MKNMTGATMGRMAVLAAMNGACFVMSPLVPMTAEPTPPPMAMSVAGFALARKTLPASSDDAAVDAVPRTGRHAVPTTPPDRNGSPSVRMFLLMSALTSRLQALPRSTTPSFLPSTSSTCPTGLLGARGRNQRMKQPLVSSRPFESS